MDDRKDPDVALVGQWNLGELVGRAALGTRHALEVEEDCAAVAAFATDEMGTRFELEERQNRALSEAGRTVFVTTHYMDEAEYCHRMALMHAGKIIAMGAPATVRKERYSQALLRLDSSDTPATMRALETAEGVLDVAVFGAGLHVTVENAVSSAADIREILAARNITVNRLEAIEPSMEDLFVSLVEAEEQKKA